MIIDDLDFSKLPKGLEEAFTDFVKSISSEYVQRVRTDRETYSDHNSNYYGSYEPERSFVSAILAFVDEYGIDSQLVDISDLSNDDFSKEFGLFKSKVEYLTTRFMLRQHRIASGTIGTLISLGGDYKTEIGKLLDTARKIVNQEIKDANKKEKVFVKIARLQSEIDRDRTTVDAFFGRVLDLSKVIGEAADNLEPLVKVIERIKKAAWDSSEKVEQLPKPERPKQISKEKDKSQNSMDDEIPF